MNIIKELYYGNIAESQRPNKVPRKLLDKELKAYDNLKSNLTYEQSKLLDNFIEIMSDNHSIEKTETYISGFKTGLLLGVESSKIDVHN